MKKLKNNHAFLILSDCVSESLVRLFLQIKSSTAHLGDTFIVYHNKSGSPEKRLLNYNPYEFTNSVMNELGYTPVRDRLVPGSNHFPIIKFHLDHPQYDFYWCIEDDIIFTGDWKSFFNQNIQSHDYDFLSSFIKYYSEKVNPNWMWWSSLSKPGIDVKPDDLAMSFNPIYSLSNRAATFLDKSLKEGWVGHHEVLMATLLIANKFKVIDFGGSGTFVPADCKDKFYTDSTYLWRPVFEAPGNLLNKIYHPVKERFKVTKEFKYKISFCVTGKINLNHLKQTLLTNIEENLDYKNFEFILLDYGSERGVETWLKKSANEYIKNGKIVYYKTHLGERGNDSGAKNTLSKLATGDVLCFLNAESFTGRDFATFVNNQFKTNAKTVIVDALNAIAADEPVAKPDAKVLCLLKEEFLHAKGFDEEIKNTSSANIDLIKRLKTNRVAETTVDDKAVNFPNENCYLGLDKILVHYRNPALSTILFMHHNGTFEMGTLVDNSSKGFSEFKHAYLKRKSALAYSFKATVMMAGRWHSVNDKLIFIADTGTEFNMTMKESWYETTLANQPMLFYSITDLTLKKRLINCYHQYKNMALLKSYHSKKGFKLNQHGFGQAIVFQNFNYDYPLAVN